MVLMDLSINMKKFGVVLCGKINDMLNQFTWIVETEPNFSHRKKIKLAGSENFTKWPSKCLNFCSSYSTFNMPLYTLTLMNLHTNKWICCRCTLKKVTKSCHAFGMDLKYIYIISHISTLKVMCRHYTKQSCQPFQKFRSSSTILIFESASQHIIQLKSQSVSLGNSGKQFSSLNLCRSSTNLQSHLGGCFPPLKRLPTIAGVVGHHMLKLFESIRIWLYNRPFCQCRDLNHWALGL